MSWQTSLLCIVGKLAGGGSVAVAVAVGVGWHVTCDRWHITCDIFFFLFFLGFVWMIWLSVLLSAHIERLSVSRLRYFLPIFLNFLQVPIYPPLLHITCSLSPTWREGRRRGESSSSSWVLPLWPRGACQHLTIYCCLLLARFSLQNKTGWTIHDLGGNLIVQFSVKI